MGTFNTMGSSNAIDATITLIHNIPVKTENISYNSPDVLTIGFLDHSAPDVARIQEIIAVRTPTSAGS